MGFLESLDRLDREAFFALAGQGGPMADAVFAVISSTWAAVAVWFLLWAMRRRDVDMASWIWLLIAMLAAYALADWTSSALKELLARPRPCWELEGRFRLVGRCKGQFGLVSGHAATTWALLTVFWRSQPPRGLAALALLWSLSVPVSRIYLGVHYPGDVLAGALVGIALGALILRIRPLPSRA
jgi:undecaprenyl-diphosphatase